jgi:hypothetical protein
VDQQTKLDGEEAQAKGRREEDDELNLIFIQFQV